MDSATCKWNPQIVSGIHKVLVEFAFCLHFQLKIADSTYFLRIPLAVDDSRTTSYIRLLRNPRQNKCADIIYVTLICTRNPRKFVSGINLHFGTCLNISFWNRGTFRHKIVRLYSAQFGLVMRSR